jgi:hypothetical protein
MAATARKYENLPIISTCCVCGDVRDDLSPSGAWSKLAAYTRRHGIDERVLLFSHTFCPPCFMHYKEAFGLNSEKPKLNLVSTQ